MTNISVRSSLGIKKLFKDIKIGQMFLVDTKLFQKITRCEIVGFDGTEYNSLELETGLIHRFDNDQEIRHIQNVEIHIL